MILPDDASLKKTTATVISAPSGISAERKEPFAQPPEKAPIVERVPPKEMEPGVKDWLKKLETGEDIQLPQPVTDNQGQVIVSPSSPHRKHLAMTGFRRKSFYSFPQLPFTSSRFASNAKKSMEKLQIKNRGT